MLPRAVLAAGMPVLAAAAAPAPGTLMPRITGTIYNSSTPQPPKIQQTLEESVPGGGSPDKAETETTTRAGKGAGR